MVKIIETNILMKDDNIADHQSRVIQVDSWDAYIKMYENYDSKAFGYDFKPEMGCLRGNSLPKEVTIKQLKYNDATLTCELELQNRMKQIKLAYLIWGCELNDCHQEYCDFCAKEIPDDSRITNIFQEQDYITNGVNEPIKQYAIQKRNICHGCIEKLYKDIKLKERIIKMVQLYPRTGGDNNV